MVSPYLYESDIDYLRAGMSAAALKLEAFDEGDESAIESFTAYLEAKGELGEIVHSWGLQHQRHLQAWAEAAAEDDKRVAGEEKAERFGLM